MPNLPVVGVILYPDQLSDLFFNYDHPKRDALYKQFTGPALEASFTEDEERAAVLEDAKEFVATLGIPDEGISPALADDFMRRR
jgi:hypothetical protein